MRYILYEHNCNWWAKDICIVKGEVLKRIYRDGEFQETICSETTLTGESWFHISTPQAIWTRVPCDRKQTGSPLDQWDMLRMKWDCRLSTGLPPQQPTLLVVKPEGKPAESVKPGKESCVRSNGIITLLVQGPSDGSGQGPPQLRPQWSIMSRSPM